MRAPRTLSLYVLREVLQYGGLGLLGVGSILVTQNLLRRLEDLVDVGVTASDTLVLASSVVAMLAAYALPVAFLFGVLVALGRLSADSEITAMRALGVSIAQLAAPVVALSVVVALLTGWMLGSVEPDARRRLRALAGEIAARGSVFQPGHFQRLDREGRRIIFVERVGPETGTNRLEGVLIDDRSDPARPFTVVAERAHFEIDTGTAEARLGLEAGDVHFEPSEAGDESYRRIAFQRFDYAFDLSEVIGADQKQIRPPEMQTALLRDALAHFDREGRAPDWSRVKKREIYEVEIARRLALPLGPILFALLGVPLGLRRSRGARSWGALICVGLVFLYYALLSFGTFLAKEQVVPALLALWLPNLVFGAAALWLCLRARSAEI
jgi:lipopolysaccharide export system permease protein